MKKRSFLSVLFCLPACLSSLGFQRWKGGWKKPVEVEMWAIFGAGDEGHPHRVKIDVMPMHGEELRIHRFTAGTKISIFSRNFNDALCRDHWTIIACEAIKYRKGAARLLVENLNRWNPNAFGNPCPCAGNILIDNAQTASEIA